MAWRLGLVASAVTATVAATVAVRRIAAERAASPAAVHVALLTPPPDPIAAEARVFLTRPGLLASDPSFKPSRPAHPRTLVTYRALRAYDGAPPRVPHGLTPSEFRTGGCNTCHERGGFSQRFGAYVPVTPHPEMGACLQCHVGDAMLMAIALPSSEPSDRCRQCHAPGAMRWTEGMPAWRGLAAPALARGGPAGAPPPIPHDLAMRGNCLACHSAPGGVVELRTSHPERANCRQCHVTNGEGA
jgi:cytochrome c-type protein NapB